MAKPVYSRQYGNQFSQRKSELRRSPSLCSFWGHDEAREVSFLLEEDALTQIDQTAPRTEAEFLVAFDDNRDRIFRAARKVYSRRGSGFHTLAASDF